MICKNCNEKADTIQHLFQKCATNPNDYTRLPLCKLCHNQGSNCSNRITQLILNNIENVPNTQTVFVNGISVKATAGSVLALQNVCLPNGTFSLSVENKNTDRPNDFQIIPSRGNSFFVSGANLVSGAIYVALSQM